MAGTTITHADPVLEKLCAALQATYGDRIELIVLFGSRARGDARPDSNYDVASNCSPLTACRSGGDGGAEAGEGAPAGEAAGRDNGAQIGVDFRAPP